MKKEKPKKEKSNMSNGKDKHVANGTKKSDPTPKSDATTNALEMNGKSKTIKKQPRNFKKYKMKPNKKGKSKSK
jgi:hypothetical protein